MKPQPRYHPGDKIGERYLVHEALMGGMGEVYLCLDLKTIQPFALKTFQARYLNNPKIHEAFNNEVATWVALENHPNVVKCFYLEFIDDQPFMMLEWVANDERHGTDLRSWMRFGPLDLKLALDFTIDICRGLIHANLKQPGIVHRDLKPDNILVAQGHLAKITDFGLAKIVQETKVKISTHSKYEACGRQSLMGLDGIVGTPPYMAPEQWLGESLDTRTDIYAVGCVFYEMLIGEWPFHTSTIEELRHQHLEGYIPRIAESLCLPDFVDMILARCMSRQQKDRFATFDELLQELEIIYKKQFDESPRILPPIDELSVYDYINRGNTYGRLQRHAEALSDLNKAVDLDPKNSLAYYNRGTLYQNLDRYQDAQLDFDKAIEFDPKHAESYVNRGINNHEFGRYEEAIIDFNKAIDLDNNFAKAYCNRSLTYTNLQQYKAALTDANKAISLDSQDAKNHVNCGFAYYFLGSLDAALINFTNAIELDPKLFQAYKGRGLTYQSLNLNIEAKVDYTMAISIDPNDSDIYYNRGVINFYLHLYDEALVDLTHAIDINPGSKDAYIGRANVYGILQRYEDVLKDFTRIIEFGSNDAIVYINRGVANIKLNRYKEGLSDLKHAISIEPRNGQAYFYMALALTILGKFDESLAYARGALRLGIPDASELIREIERKRGLEPEAGPVPKYFEVFIKTNSFDEVKCVVTEFPFIAGPDFIQTLEQAIESLSPEDSSAFRQRITWLRQIAAEHKREENNR